MHKLFFNQPKIMFALLLLFIVGIGSTFGYSETKSSASQSKVLLPAKSPQNPPIAVISQATPQNAQVFLKSGDDLKGQVIAYQPNKLFIKTTAGLRVVNLKYYHGLVLDTPEEQLFGDHVTHHADVFTAAIDYAQKIRPLLSKQLEINLKKLPDVCKPTRYPLAHLQLNKAGKVIRAELLTRSDCPHLNLAMAQAIKQTPFFALPKDYPINIYVLNYFFPIPSQSIANTSQPAVNQKPDSAPAASQIPPKK